MGPAVPARRASVRVTRDYYRSRAAPPAQPPSVERVRQKTTPKRALSGAVSSHPAPERPPLSPIQNRQPDQTSRQPDQARCAADRTPPSSVRCPDVASAWTAALLQLLRNCRSARMGPSATAKTRCPSASQQPARPSRLEFAGTSLARAHVEISWHYCTAALCRRCISRSSPTRGRHFDCHY